MRPHRIILRRLKQLAVLRSKRRVDFVIAGAQKGGTTALDAYLRQHPEIGMADVKEVHFFDNEKFFRAGKPPLSFYHSFFSGVLSRRRIGETTPSYMYWRAIPQRIRDYNPAMKLVVILRNPIERAYSHWNMERERGTERLSFGAALQAELVRAREAQPNQHKNAYIHRGFYAGQIERIWSCFPKNQTLILKNEDLRKNPLETLNEVCRFLEVSPFEKIENKEAHSRQYLEPMNEHDRKFLKQMLEPEIKKLEKLLDWDCSRWLAN
jgi:Sulfotransferase domain